MSVFFTAAKIIFLKDPFNEQIIVHKKLIFFTLHSNIINNIQEW